MRKGFAETKGADTKGDGTDAAARGVTASVRALASVRVWLPYLLNQVGSLLYYKTLASSRLTLAVPICNATAMVFSSVTGTLLGERVDRPGRAAAGVALVLAGVAVCMHSSDEGSAKSVGEGGALPHGEL
jgi:hypothetical protein